VVRCLSSTAVGAAASVVGDGIKLKRGKSTSAYVAAARELRDFMTQFTSLRTRDPGTAL
jgi:hypothetical protein